MNDVQGILFGVGTPPSSFAFEILVLIEHADGAFHGRAMVTGQSPFYQGEGLSNAVDCYRDSMKAVLQFVRSEGVALLSTADPPGASQLASEADRRKVQASLGINIP